MWWSRIWFDSILHTCINRSSSTNGIRLAKYLYTSQNTNWSGCIGWRGRTDSREVERAGWTYRTISHLCEIEREDARSVQVEVYVIPNLRVSHSENYVDGKLMAVLDWRRSPTLYLNRSRYFRQNCSRVWGRVRLWPDTSLLRVWRWNWGQTLQSVDSEFSKPFPKWQ